MSSIRDFVFSQPLFETHTHQNRFEHHAWSAVSWEELLAYGTADFATSSGLSFDELSKGGTLWDWWPFVRTTGYGRAAELGCKELTGLDLTKENAAAITQALQRLIVDLGHEGVYRMVYRTADVRWSVNDPCWFRIAPIEVVAGEQSLDLVRTALRYDQLLVPRTKADVAQIAKDLGARIRTLADHDQALDDYTARAHATGRLAALKIGLAYERDLAFGHVKQARAAALFAKLMQGERADLRPLHDYLFRRTLDRASRMKLPVQIHTGYLSGNWGDFTRANPALLMPVLESFKDVRFDLFHAGWPYAEVACAIGKAFPNVWLNMCWMWAMNAVQGERILDEWLGAVPNNKILAFGADTGSPFNLVGYARQAREGIAHVLENKIARGEYDQSTAEHVARRIMFENGRDLYRM